MNQNLTKSKKNKTKPRTINDMLRANKAVNQTIQNQQVDDKSSARNCPVNEIDGSEICWVECGRCSSKCSLLYLFLIIF